MAKVNHKVSCRRERGRGRGIAVQQCLQRAKNLMVKFFFSSSSQPGIFSMSCSAQKGAHNCIPASLCCFVLPAALPAVAALPVRPVLPDVASVA